MRRPAQRATPAVAEPAAGGLQTGEVAPRDLKAEFEEVYRQVVQDAIKANLQNNSAANPDFWSNSRDFCFSTKPPRPSDLDAAKIVATPGLRWAPPPVGVNPKWPIYEAETETGKAQLKKLNDLLAQLKGKEKPTPEDLAQLAEAAIPFIQTLRAAELARGIVVKVPPMSKVTYSYSTHCLQVDAPAVGSAAANRAHRAVGQNRPVRFYPAGILIPKEAQELYAGIINYESTHPESRALVHTLLWGIRGADLKPPFGAPNAEQLKLLDAAIPDGAKKWAAFVELAQNPKKGKPTAGQSEDESDGNGLLTLDRAKSTLLRHHLDTVTINHGSANPFDPANVDAILQRLTNPGPVPEFEVQPVDQTVQAGTSATFSARVTGNGLKYQWQFNDKDLSDAHSDTLTVQAGSPTVGVYQLLVSTPSVTIKSDRVRLRLASSTGGASRPSRPSAGSNSARPNRQNDGSTDSDPYGSGTADSDPYGATPAQPPRLSQAGNSSRNTPARSGDPTNNQGTGNAEDEASLLAPGVAATGRQNGLSDGTATIVNTTNTVYILIPTNWIVATTEPCQPSSIGPSDLSRPAAPTAKSEVEAAKTIGLIQRPWYEVVSEFLDRANRSMEMVTDWKHWVAGVGIAQRGKWTGLYMSGGNPNTLRGEIGDPYVKPEDIADAAARVHDILCYLGVPEAADRSKRWLLSEWARRGGDSALLEHESKVQSESYMWVVQEKWALAPDGLWNLTLQAAGKFLAAPSGVLDDGVPDRWENPDPKLKLKPLDDSTVQKCIKVLNSENFPLASLPTKFKKRYGIQ